MEYNAFTIVASGHDILYINTEKDRLLWTPKSPVAPEQKGSMLLDLKN